MRIPRCETCGVPVSWHRDASREIRDQQAREDARLFLFSALDSKDKEAYDSALPIDAPERTGIQMLYKGRVMTVYFILEETP